MAALTLAPRAQIRKGRCSERELTRTSLLATHVMDKYFLGPAIGEGQFGTVRLAVVKETGALVAIKLIRVTRLSEGIPHPIARELLIASRVDHPLLIRTLEIIPYGSSMALVMERCHTDLAALLRTRTAKAPLDLGTAVELFRSLVTALHYLHSEGILHRDIKPGNCFLTADGLLKVGDFGLSRLRGDDMSHEVASRWYRAPELLFGTRHYGYEVDMWSAGCVLGELLRGFGGAVFAGDGDINQLSKIFDVLGTPNEEVWPGVTTLPDWGKVQFDAKEGWGLRAVFPCVSETAFDLLSRLLCLNPANRMSAEETLFHPFLCHRHSRGTEPAMC